MIFTTWNFGPEVQAPWTWTRGIQKTPAAMGREAARQYAADIFNICAARRDYSYADHPWPHVPFPLHWCAAVEIRYNVVREFNRSNPGNEIDPN